jgi:hypothetical protein
MIQYPSKKNQGLDFFLQQKILQKIQQKIAYVQHKIAKR